MNHLKKILLVLISGVCGVVFLAAVLIFTYPLPVNFNQLPSAESTKIFDRNGELIFELLTNEKGRSTDVPLTEIAPFIKQAIVATEDKSFYQNSGVDLRAILRAIWQNVQEQRIVSGGSTITQQLVHNIFTFDQARTFQTKLEESILAIRLTYVYSKDDLLEKYLNTIYFGNLAYGIEAASQTYFNKSARDLDLAESAFLVGLPQSPSQYNPFLNFDLAKERQKIVLDLMVQNESISPAEASAASQQELVLIKKEYQMRAPHFTEFILPQLEAQFGADKLRQGNLEIYTTLDLMVQEKIEQQVQIQLAKLEKHNVSNASVVVLNPQTGEILVMLGSQDYFSNEIDGKYNVALAERQPGSAIKPVVYLAAFQAGYLPASLIRDEETRFFTTDGLAYIPQNFDLQYHGVVTLREALGNSFNIPAVKLLDKVGLKPVLSLAKRLGISTFDKSAEHFGLALTLGGAEVKLLELTEVYGVLANGGRKPDWHWLQEVRFKTNEQKQEVISFASQSSEPIVKPEEAYLITNILSDNSARIISFGEDNILKTNYPSAVKTGTTRNFKDNWTIGYTPQRVVGVWVGNNDNSPMKEVSGITGAGPIWRQTMDLIHQNLPVQSFQKPAGLMRKEFCYQHKCRSELFWSAQKYNKSVDQLTEVLDLEYQTDSIPNRLIQKPLADSVYQISAEVVIEKQKVALISPQDARWFVDGELIGQGKKVFWMLVAGQHKIKARFGDTVEEITIYVLD